MKLRLSILIAIVMVIVPIAFAADDWQLPLNEPQLKPGAGVEIVSANCQVCHSADYIFTQPRLNRAAWVATVQKMREKYGAPLDTNLVDQIVTYLVDTYGKK